MENKASTKENNSQLHERSNKASKIVSLTHPIQGKYKINVDEIKVKDLKLDNIKNNISDTHTLLFQP